MAEINFEGAARAQAFAVKALDSGYVNSLGFSQYRSYEVFNSINE